MEPFYNDLVKKSINYKDNCNYFLLKYNILIKEITYF